MPQGVGVEWLKGVVLVDKGAAIALAKGAHLMIPGVVDVEGSFSRGDVVAALYHESRTPVMVGVAEVDSGALEKMSREKARGRAVRRVHRLGDVIWELSQEIGKRLS
ncbi:PUA domain-containing protein [Aeropyrum camini]|uniref:PUA domain-containing protein n=1 Tax=Aeropyrum camini TaxID=229980 RepID=UPI000787129B|nr:PUA domain-containing protein [Aeropyrum camini]